MATRRQIGEAQRVARALREQETSVGAIGDIAVDVTGDEIFQIGEPAVTAGQRRQTPVLIQIEGVRREGYVVDEMQLKDGRQRVDLDVRCTRIQVVFEAARAAAARAALAPPVRSAVNMLGAVPDPSQGDGGNVSLIGATIERVKASDPSQNLRRDSTRLATGALVWPGIAAPDRIVWPLIIDGAGPRVAWLRDLGRILRAVNGTNPSPSHALAVLCDTLESYDE